MRRLTARCAGATCTVITMSFSRFVCTAAMIPLLAACGQKGPLILPDDARATPSSQRQPEPREETDGAGMPDTSALQGKELKGKTLQGKPVSGKPLAVKPLSGKPLASKPMATRPYTIE
jgi:predicted small lipoprotein YifL